MPITTVLFDLDGTLLPMDQDVFISAYFKGLAARIAPHGYEPKALIQSIWAGTAAMIQNDGSKSNEQAFWENFAGHFGEKAREDEPLFAEFYRTDFQQVQAVCGYEPMAAKVVRQLKEAGKRVVLATNPIFPAIATESRIRWAGLLPADFELYTTYENSSFCKPNLAYYKEILEKLQVSGEECLMVGNDVGEDMIARSLGMKVFLLTPCLINKGNLSTDEFPSGDFDRLLQFMEEEIL